MQRATGRFQNDGELPDDELVRDSVLALGELHGLTMHAIGGGDPELMAAFDAAARATKQTREDAVARIRELVRDGRLLAQCGSM